MKKLLFFLLVALGTQFYAQKFFNPVKHPAGQLTLPDDRVPSEYLLYKVEKQQLLQALTNAPDQFTSRHSDVKIAFPLADGSIETFEMFRTHPLAPELEARFPRIKSYRGVNKKGLRIRLDINGSGVFYAIYGTGNAPSVFQLAYDDQTYMLYRQSDQAVPENHVCLVEEAAGIDEEQLQNLSVNMFNDGLIRKYRLAYAANGEFSQYHVQLAINNGTIPSNATDAQKKQAVLDALTVIVNRNNEVYEVDFGITLELVANNTNIIYLDPNSDPYSNSSSDINVNQSVIDNAIGSANYDIGHVATTGGGGIASLGSVCTNQKARGVTGQPNPIGDQYTIDYFAHEVGHQFGATHTFANYCGGSRTSSTAVEPGSGSSIMAYAGICSPNVQNNSDPQFHYVSQAQIWNHVISTTCAQTINSGNNAPSVSAGPDRWIPKNTPFVLIANASDPDNNTLQYTWDEVDVYTGSASSYTPNPSNTNGPMFRSVPMRSENFRFFPRIEDVMNGSYGNTWEALPNVQRTLTFRAVVRDMVTPGGQIATDEITLGIDANTGPFRVTSHATDVTWQPGSNQTITWNVAGTTGGNVNCSTVDILLSTDGGQSYPIILASNTPNDGSHTVTIPSSVTAYNARYMVKGHNNYFFDVNKGNITIGSFTESCNNFSQTANDSIPDNDPNGVSSTINISNSFTISDLNLHVDISHTYIQDLRIKLTSPQGTEVYVWDRNCGGQDNINITFDDEASNTIDCNNADAGNAYQPTNPLSAFDGENAQGTWTLTVSDHYNQDTGILNSWTLRLCQILDVDDNQVENLEIYPVPADEYIHIKFDARNPVTNIRITDINGREIFSRRIENSGSVFQSVDVSQWSRGVYLVNITDGSRKSVRKVIIR